MTRSAESRDRLTDARGVRRASPERVPVETTARPVMPAPLAQDLLDSLAALHHAMKGLSALATEKLGAIRRADAAGLQACADREEQLLRRMFCDEPRRKALLARVAQTLRCPAEAGNTLTAIADALPEPLRSSLRARNAALHAIAIELQQKNRVAAAVARNLQAHIRGIFAAVAGATGEALVYGPQGRHEPGRPRCWVDAIG